MPTTKSAIKASVWYGLEDSGNYEVEGEDMVTSVERTDEDEVALHALIPSGDVADVSLFVTRAGALALAHLLTATALQENVGS